MGVIRAATVIGIVVLVCWPKSAGADPGIKAKCIPPGDKQIAVLERAAQLRTQAAYEAALLRRGLRKARVGGGTLKLHRGIRGGPNQRGYRPDTMVTATVNGVTGRYLAGRRWWTGAARAPSPPELVTDGKGIYYFVRRQPKQGPVTRVLLCGCKQRQCGPYGSGCPACHATIQQMYGPFGPKDRFGGYTDVVYRSHSVRLKYQRGACPPRRCPAPAPSMRRR